MAERPDGERPDSAVGDGRRGGADTDAVDDAPQAALPDIASLELQVIGVARTPWTRREDAPHQPTAAARARGTIEIASEYRQALADLASFSRIWLIFGFHRSHGWAARVKPPRGGVRRGVLATRAPNRPSQLGLTNVEILGVDVTSGRIEVQGLDLLDGTPVLDIKPYLPMVDCHPEAGHGWLEPFLEAGVEPRLKKPYRPMR
jgi:tRNA-Thr(GGU) m(6)t(6)A37 methyltransferase TsaA